RRQRDGEAADHVQRRRDHPAVQDLADRIADQFGPHLEPQARRLGIKRIELEPEHAVERDHLLEGAPDLRLDALDLAPAGHIDSLPSSPRSSSCPGLSRASTSQGDSSKAWM